MQTFTELDQDKNEVTFEGELLTEGEDEHQVERDAPMNTETTKLYRTSDGGYLLSISFCFDGMYPHYHAIYQGSTPGEILASIRIPSELTQRMLTEAETSGATATA